MKKICSITLYKEIEKEEPQIQKNEKGEEVKVLVKVKSKIPYNYFITKPSFTIRQKSVLYYESVVAECIRNNILSAIQLRKRFVDDGGIFGEEEKKNYMELWKSLWERKSELNKLSEESEKNNDKIKEVNSTILNILGELQQIEERSGNALMYEHTAEKIANDRVTLWLMLNLSYQDLGNNKFKPVFGEGEFEEKIKIYEQMDGDEDAFEVDLCKRLLLATNLWYMGRASKQEEFDEIFESAANRGIISPLKKE